VQATVRWLDARGSLVKTVNWPAQAPQLEVDIRDLPQGVYVVQTQIKGQLYSERVIKH
jgi:hypothetical protein